MTQLTLGSLFDGIAGFPLAGIWAGIKPVWASEIEPFPIRVVRKRLPDMKHYLVLHIVSSQRFRWLGCFFYCPSFSLSCSAHLVQPAFPDAAGAKHSGCSSGVTRNR